MTESQAVAIATQYAKANGLPCHKVRKAAFDPVEDPLHLPWMPDTWWIFFDDVDPLPVGMEDFGGLCICVDCTTGKAKLHQPM